MSQNFTSVAPRVISVKSINTNPTSNIIIKEKIKDLASNITNLGRRETHVDRSDSFISKGIRFLKADEYTYVSTNYDKFLIINTIIVTIIALISFIWVISYGTKIKQVYIYTDTSGNNDDLKKINLFSTITFWIKVVLGGAACIASYYQIKTIYKANTFRTNNKIKPYSLSE